MRTALIEDRVLARQLTAVRRAVLLPAEVENWLPAVLCDLAESLRQRGVVPNGFPFARRHLSPGGQIAVETGFPVGVPVQTDQTTLASTLPAGPAAVTMYAGRLDEVGAAYDLIAEWLRRRGAYPAGDAWEIYHNPPTGHPEKWQIEVVQPYHPAFYCAN